jgi:hypothetical protein
MRVSLVPSSGRLESHCKLITVSILQLLGVVEEAFIREVIYVDPVNQVTSMASINLSLSQYM